MYASMLPILPPPSTSLLPPLHAPVNEGHQNSHLHTNSQLQQQRRNKHLHHPRSSVHLLTLDERAISQRKMAIAMYGYSWLKPAGCSKTMLGRREEELEKEESERQLREVEMQERLAAEGEAEAEAERLAEMRRLELEAEAGGDVPGERDLDDDIPEAEDVSEDEDADSGDEVAAEEDMEGDLDDDIPDADADADETSWAYDTNRDADTASDSENGQSDLGQVQGGTGMNTARNRHRMASARAQSAFTGMREAAETEAMVNAMLDEDELGEIHRRDHEELDMDLDMDMDMDMDEAGRDLDDDIPEAENEGEWQHTDTELDESDMDISVLPNPHQPSPRESRHGSARSQRSDHRMSHPRSGIGPGTTHEEIRRVSGNIMMPPPLPVPSQPQSRTNWPRNRNITPQNRAYNTPSLAPETNDSIPNLLSTDGSSLADSGAGMRPAANSTTTDRTRTARSWLSAAGARRNLFGTSRAGGGSAGDSSGSGFTPDPPRGQAQAQAQAASSQVTNQSTTSSGGLFTPSPRVSSSDQTHVPSSGEMEPRSRTRSGRLPAGHGGRGRSNRS